MSVFVEGLITTTSLCLHLPQHALLYFQRLSQPLCLTRLVIDPFHRPLVPRWRRDLGLDADADVVVGLPLALRLLLSLEAVLANRPGLSHHTRRPTHHPSSQHPPLGPHGNNKPTTTNTDATKTIVDNN